MTLGVSSVAFLLYSGHTSNSILLFDLHFRVFTHSRDPMYTAW